MYNLVPPGPLFRPPNPTYRFLSKPTTLLAFPLRPPKKCNLLALYSPPLQIPTRNHQIHSQSPPTGSTRTIATLVAVALSLSKHLASRIPLLLLKFRPALPNANTLAIESRPQFFAATSDRRALMSAGTPITVIAAGQASWLKIYSCVLLIRVLEIQGKQQTISAIKDLCGPHMSLFRGIIPPLFNSLDVSPILAFLLLGMLGQLASPQPWTSTTSFPLALSSVLPIPPIASSPNPQPSSLSLSALPKNANSSPLTHLLSKYPPETIFTPHSPGRLGPSQPSLPSPSQSPNTSLPKSLSSSSSNFDRLDRIQAAVFRSNKRQQRTNVHGALFHPCLILWMLALFWLSFCRR